MSVRLLVATHDWTDQILACVLDALAEQKRFTDAHPGGPSTNCTESSCEELHILSLVIPTSSSDIIRSRDEEIKNGQNVREATTEFSTLITSKSPTPSSVATVPVCVRMRLSIHTV